MTKSIKFGVRENTPPTRKENKKPTNRWAKIDDVEVKHIQHENKIANEKIEQAYYEAIDRLNKAQGFIIEGVLRKHAKKEEEDL